MGTLAIVSVIVGLLLIAIGSIVAWPVAVGGALVLLLAIVTHSATARNGGQRL